ncbi:MAG: LytTR family DNA-binding domain-containing protein [Lachnospiraceae bacterium]|nr:LytTR family DNA-binding domain-containing protein [Lachnospiraceae bacterium]
MFRIAICEDDPAQRDYEEALITRWSRDRKYKIALDACSTAEQLLFECEDRPPYDLLVLDIQMGKMNGMELAAELRRNGCDAAIIFLTGIPDYAIEGYAVGAVRYLLKPIHEADFLSLLDALYGERTKDAEAYFILEQSGVARKIKLGEIVYVEARGHYIYMKMSAGEDEWKGAFSSLQAELEARGFFLLKRGLLVNLAHIEQISRTECILGDGTALPVARSKYRELNEAFIAYYHRALNQTG